MQANETIFENYYSKKKHARFLGRFFICPKRGVANKPNLPVNVIACQ